MSAFDRPAVFPWVSVFCWRIEQHPDRADELDYATLLDKLYARSPEETLIAEELGLFEAK